MALVETDVRVTTPARILDATFRALQDFGLSRLTVEDVAQRAGLSRQTVYRYFPSKDHLMMALVSREEETFLDGVGDRSEGRHHHEGGVALRGLGLLHQPDAVEAGHLEVGQDDVGIELGELAERLEPVSGRVGDEAVLVQDLAQRGASVRLVVDDENPTPRRHASLRD